MKQPAGEETVLWSRGQAPVLCTRQTEPHRAAIGPESSRNSLSPGIQRAREQQNLQHSTLQPLGHSGCLNECWGKTNLFQEKHWRNVERKGRQAERRKDVAQTCRGN